MPHGSVSSDMDMQHFKTLKEGENGLISALKLSKKHGGVLTIRAQNVKEYLDLFCEP
jgi:hypothetical protein